jgi:cytochrome c5
MKYKFFLFVIAAIVLAACVATPTVQPTPTYDAVQLQGYDIYKLRCAQCHALTPETVVIGPSLAGVATRATMRESDGDAQAYIETSILNPSAYVVSGFKDVMPKSFAKDLTSDEFNAVVQFLLTLK